MATPQEKLADALEALKGLQDEGQVAIKSAYLARDHRERLLKAGFIAPVMKGWYIPVRPEEVGDGETTAWYASFWDFCAAYLEYRFNSEWSLSPEQSVLIHAGNRTVPFQLMVRSPRARNNITDLLHDTSILEIRAQTAEGNQRETVEGLHTFKLPHALVHSADRLFKHHATDARTALAQIRDASELLSILLDGGHSTIAGRLAGALRTIGHDRIADNIVKAMRAAGYSVSETNPFADGKTVSLPRREPSPHVSRIRTSWLTMREQIIDSFPRAARSANRKEKNTWRRSTTSTSLMLITRCRSKAIALHRNSSKRVRSGTWNPDRIEADTKQRDAMAARGYWLAFNEVKKSIEKVLESENPGTIADHDHGDWYRALFSPSVDAGILKNLDLAGYRNDQVFIRGSKHVPIKKEAVLDCMPALFDLLTEEEHPAVRVVLGHWVFVYVHPYMDGNGRMGRFLMNLMMASGGYPWTVITVEKRSEYMQALESASVEGDIFPFTKFLAGLLTE